MSGPTKTGMLICNIPFNTITYSPKGFQSCCMHSMKEHEVKSAKEFWNHPEMKAMRKGFLEGKPIGQCAECVKYYEKLKKYRGLPPPGFFFGHVEDVWKERGICYENYITDDMLEEVTELNPIIAVLNVSNKCNLQCRTCSPYLSDSQAALRRKAGFENITDKYCKRSADEFMHEVNGFPELKEVLLVGGEPMLDPVFLDMLKKLRKDVAVRVQCNGTIYNEEFMDEMMKFRECSLMFSIDGGKEVNEYMRNGIDQEKFWDNVRRSVVYMVKRSNTVRFKLTSVMSNVSAFGIRELFDEIVENLTLKAFDDNFFSFNYITLTYPKYFRVETLPNAERIRLLKKLISDRNHFERYIKQQPCKTHVLANTMVSVCRGVASLLEQTPCDDKAYEEFRAFNDRYDKLVGGSVDNIIGIKEIK